ncbi:hypothetical protein [Polaribacter sp. IC073]|uniref:hypothetical protein n=1 Tax=Polaribacter sp. IC073 TaxID=2508540 RepID=UPI0011BF96BD|nr:hypothetical protein [Polaribacter sp. IC073]TXD47346.1 hypothetical protein ES045_12170 [Polaribacter sp. IC073]
MTKEQLFLEIDEIYSEWHGGDLYIGQERENRIKQVIEKAINYTQCCKELFCGEQDEGSQKEKCVVKCDVCSFIDKKVAK